MVLIYFLKNPLSLSLSLSSLPLSLYSSAHSHSSAHSRRRCPGQPSPPRRRRTGLTLLSSWNALQGFSLRGNSLKIEFARPVEGMNNLISEVAVVSAQEKAMLDECEALLTFATAMQVEEYSLRTHLMQIKQTLENDLKELWSLLNLLLLEKLVVEKSFQKEGPTQNAEDDWLETEKKIIIRKQ